MNAITVEVDRLKEKLTENMATHEADFDIAWDAYAKAVVKNVEEILRSAHDMKKGQAINLYVNLTTPVNHKDDYARALEMLDWHQEEEITITEQEFMEFVQDDWDWKHQFTASNSFYTGSASPSSITNSRRKK